jgi:hypothetical protein
MCTSRSAASALIGAIAHNTTTSAANRLNIVFPGSAATLAAISAAVTARGASRPPTGLEDRKPAEFAGPEIAEVRVAAPRSNSVGRRRLPEGGSVPNRLISKTIGAAILAAGLCLSLLAAGPASAQAADFSGAPASSDARQVADWVLGTGDNHNQPFVIVDKKATVVFVFDGHGQLLGATSALIGLARGDDSAPGIGERKLSDIRPDERTTPAGRFVASLGHDLGSQDVLWVDYKTALALHRVLAANTREHRLERLAAASASAHRITFGCINVPVRFYDRVVHPAFTGTSGVVYILPEIKSIAEVFFSAT